MNASSLEETYVMEEKFDKALKTLRRALADVDLEVAGELDADSTPPRARILLVDCPLLDFEALALDRASAVFLPIHILVSEVDGHTQVSVVNPTELFDARLPVGIADPMARLRARIVMALEAATPRCDPKPN